MKFSSSNYLRSVSYCESFTFLYLVRQGKVRLCTSRCLVRTSGMQVYRKQRKRTRRRDTRAPLAAWTVTRRVLANIKVGPFKAIQDSSSGASPSSRQYFMSRACPGTAAFTLHCPWLRVFTLSPCRHTQVSSVYPCSLGLVPPPAGMLG